jgi:hypothetical protein
MTLSPTRSKLLELLADNALPIYHEQKQAMILSYLKTLPASERTTKKKRAARACLEAILKQKQAGIDPSAEHRGGSRVKLLPCKP